MADRHPVQHAHDLALQHLAALRSRIEDATNNELLVLTSLWAAGERGTNQLARDVGMTSGGASLLVDRLVERGLVHRAAHGEDARRVLVGLSPGGLRLLAETAG